MEKNLFIDASHPNETRIVLKSDSSIEEYEFEDKNNLKFKNNIYLGTISRVEPSLQAAFVNFGRERHGFLAFNDIQSDYYQIPSEDKEKIKQAEEKIREDLKNKNIEGSNENFNPENSSSSNNGVSEKNLENEILFSVRFIIPLRIIVDAKHWFSMISKLIKTTYKLSCQTIMSLTVLLIYESSSFPI